MKLTETAIAQVIESRTLRLRIALALGFSERWIERVIKSNKINGPLTTVSALRVIEQETGLSEDQILEGSEVRA